MEETVFHADSTLARWRQPFHVGGVALTSRITLAPLAGYTNLPFRLCVRDVGSCGLCTTDLLNARAILQKSRRTEELLATSPEDRPLATQLYGTGDEMARAAQWLEAYGATLIDINMGCPVRKVVKGGGGSAMMCDTTGGTIGMVRQVVEAVTIPVTVKMRLGWDSQHLTAPYFAREFEKAGVAAVTIHGRTRAQGFGGQVDLDGIRQVVDAVEKIPVIGNGDVRTVDDAKRMLAATGCDAIAIGRGALANPWIFRQIDRWLHTGEPGPKGTRAERIDLMAAHFQRLIDWRGEHLACLQFRKMATWHVKALRAGRAIQQTLVMLDTPETFDRIVARLREQELPPGWAEWDASEASVAVPAGPNAHW
jgi:nifR3 family TIM-barrel protein